MAPDGSLRVSEGAKGTIFRVRATARQGLRPSREPRRRRRRCPGIPILGEKPMSQLIVIGFDAEDKIALLLFRPAES